MGSFFKDKGRTTDKGKNSFEGEPNTNRDYYRKEDGKFRRRRKFGKDGYAVKDYDAADNHKKHDHVHEITREGGRNPQDRKPNKKEEREIKKAKKKRRAWYGD